MEDKIDLLLTTKTFKDTDFFVLDSTRPLESWDAFATEDANDISRIRVGEKHDLHNWFVVAHELAHVKFEDFNSKLNAFLILSPIALAFYDIDLFLIILIVPTLFSLNSIIREYRADRTSALALIELDLRDEVTKGIAFLESIKGDHPVKHILKIIFGQATHPLPQSRIRELKRLLQSK